MHRIWHVLHKPARQRVEVPLDWVGFTIDDVFVVGYGLAVLTQIALFPLFGVHASLRDNLAIGLAFTVVSFGRSLLLRRVFNWLSAMDLPVRGRPIRPD